MSSRFVKLTTRTGLFRPVSYRTGAVSALIILSLYFLSFLCATPFSIVATPVASHWSPAYCTPSFFGVFPLSNSNKVCLNLFYFSFLRSVVLFPSDYQSKSAFFSLSFCFLFPVLCFFTTTSGVQLRELESTKPNTTTSLVFEPEAYSRYLFSHISVFLFHCYKPLD